MAYIVAGAAGGLYVCETGARSEILTGLYLTETTTPASATVNYTLTCAVGAYVYTGVAATLGLHRNNVLVCAAGAYTYTGNAATLTKEIGLLCDSGAYVYTGNDATLTYVASVVAGRLKYWNGSAWVLKTLKTWDGSAWVTKTLKARSASTWI